MTPESDFWKEIAKDAFKALGGGIVWALIRRKRHRPPPLSIAPEPEPERVTLSRQQLDDLMERVNEMSTTIALHEQALERVKEDRSEVRSMRAEFTTTLGHLSDGVNAIHVLLAEMAARRA